MFHILVYEKTQKMSIAGEGLEKRTWELTLFCKIFTIDYLQFFFLYATLVAAEKRADYNEARFASDL